MNQYFDTPERDLAQAKVALRLRKDGDDIIQTLKTRGQSVAGLSERNEYNWDLPKAKLDVKKLDGECWPEQLAELDKKTLKPIFTTDFVRERAEIAWGRGKAKVVIEAALDLGHVVVGKQKEEICELELELREGEPAALLELAAELAATLALMPCDISKAERGYRLYDASSYSLSLPAPQIHAEMPLDDAFAAILWHLLGSSQRLAEQYRFNGHWRLLQDWVENLGELRALIGSPARPRHANPPANCAAPWMRCWKTGARWSRPVTTMKTFAKPRRNSSSKSCKTCAGACSHSTSRAGCWLAPGRPNVTCAATARALRKLPTGCHACWPTTLSPCNCSATSNSRKTWPSNCRASNASRPGCTMRAMWWTFLSWTVCTAN